MHTFVRVCASMCVHVYVRACMHVCVFVRVYVRACVCVCVCACMRACKCVCVRTHMHVCYLCTENMASVCNVTSMFRRPTTQGLPTVIGETWCVI